MNLIDIYRALHLKAEEYIFFSGTHGTFFRIENMLATRQVSGNLRKLKSYETSSPTPQFKSINSSALSFLHSPTLTSIHDHWKNHSLD